MLALLLLVACDPANSCEDYADAAAACTESAGGDATAYDAASICGEEWTAELESAYGDWYACQADAWRTTACATAADVSESAEAAAECPAG